jgi:hypothetical protein
MEKLTYFLTGVIPHSEMTGVDFTRIEMLEYETSPLALVWYRTFRDPAERGARIDLQKQVFLDDFESGTIDRNAFAAEAHLIVQFVHSIAAIGRRGNSALGA